MASMSAPSSVSNDPAARVPRLAGANGGAGTTYAMWRAQMRTFLMRQGVKESDYAVEIEQWTTLVQRVEDGERADEQNAIAVFLGDKITSSSSSAAAAVVKVKTEDARAPSGDEPEVAASKLVAHLIARSRKAFGFLYAALPTDLCQLVADVPQGYAFGIWSLLEKRYRNTEQDSIAALWASFTPLEQEADEDFITYKARVDSVVELLTHAKQTVPSGLYASIVTLKLQPRYTQVILALQTAGKLTDTESIDWRAITDAIGQFERKQNELGEGHGSSSSSAMIARSTSRGAQQPHRWHTANRSAPKEKRGQENGASNDDVLCFNCQQLGHYSSSCPKPPTKQTLQAQAAKASKNAATASAAKGGRQPKASSPKTAVSNGSHSSEDESESRPSSERRAHMARSHNPYAALAVQDPPTGASGVMKDTGRTYAAVAMASVMPSSATKKPQAAVTSPTLPPQVPLDEALRTTAKAVDTAANVNVTCCRESLHNVVRCKPMPVRVANGSVVYAVHKGKLTMRLRTADGQGYVKVTLHDVYYHERFDANLISWDLLDKAGWAVYGKRGRMTLTTPGGVRVQAKSTLR